MRVCNICQHIDIHAGGVLSKLVWHQHQVGGTTLTVQLTNGRIQIAHQSAIVMSKHPYLHTADLVLGLRGSHITDVGTPRSRLLVAQLLAFYIYIKV